MLHYWPPPGSKAEPKMLYEAAYWIYRVKSAKAFTEQMPSEFALWLIKKGLISNPPDDPDDLIDFIGDNLVGLSVMESHSNQLLS